MLWFRPTFSTLREKADKALLSNEFAKAIDFYQKALKCLEKPSKEAEKTVQENLQKAKESLAKINLQKAEEYLKAEQLDEAETLAQNALSFAQSVQTKDAAKTFLTTLEEYRQEEEFVYEDTEEEKEARFLGYVEAKIPFSLRENYYQLEQKLREHVLALYESERPEEIQVFLDELQVAAPTVFLYENILYLIKVREFSKALVLIDNMISQRQDDPSLYQSAAHFYLQSALQGTKGKTKKALLLPAQKNKLEQAAEYLISALELSPKGGTLYQELIGVYFFLSDPVRAENTATVGIRHVESDSEKRLILIELARVFLTQIEKAKSILEKAVSIRKHDGFISPRAALLFLELLLQSKTDIDRAFSLLSELRKRPEPLYRWYSFYYEANFLLLLQNRNEAKECLNMSLRFIESGSEEEEKTEQLLQMIEQSEKTPYR